MKELMKNITIGKTKSGVVWTAYADRHTTKDVKIMCERIVRFGGTITSEAQNILCRKCSCDDCVSAEILATKVEEPTYESELIPDRSNYSGEWQPYRSRN